MATIQSVVGVGEYLDAEDGENNWSIKNLNAKLHCLFQIMTYHIHRGIKRHWSMHVMVGHSTYGKNEKLSFDHNTGHKSYRCFNKLQWY